MHGRENVRSRYTTVFIFLKRIDHSRFIFDRGKDVDIRSYHAVDYIIKRRAHSASSAPFFLCLLCPVYLSLVIYKHSQLITILLSHFERSFIVKYYPILITQIYCNRCFSMFLNNKLRPPIEYDYKIRQTNCKRIINPQTSLQFLKFQVSRFALYLELSQFIKKMQLSN